MDDIGPSKYDISRAIQQDSSSVALAYIDFVKVHCGISHDAGIFGEVSTEMQTAYDAHVIRSDRQFFGKDIGGGQYTYEFINNSGYTLTVTVETEEGLDSFTLASSGGSHTLTLSVSSIHYDFSGGSVGLSAGDGKITFQM
ncbi:MAG: hypothetical protein LBB98_06840 [Treponema sp.]|nr:hypothetical protein [Treponema sp.]